MKIKAKISNDLSKVTRLFSGSPTSVFRELIQNARRAGCTELHAKLEREAQGWWSCTLIDNGHGIQDFQKLLTLLDSEWPDEVVETEDPAGMGFFCLSATGRPVIVRSKGNLAVISPLAFQGREEVTVVPCDLTPEKGTEVQFYMNTNENLESVFSDQVRWCGLELATVNGFERPSAEWVPRESATWSDEELGVRLSISRRNYEFGPSLSAKFAGMAVLIRPPSHETDADRQVRNVESLLIELGLEANLQILHTRKLKLVLPARDSLVSNPHLIQLVTQDIPRIVFQSLLGMPHRLNFDLYTWAKELGVELTEPDMRSVLRHYQTHPLNSELPMRRFRPADCAWSLPRHLIMECGKLLPFIPVKPNTFSGYEAYESFKAIPEFGVEVVIDGNKVQEYTPGIVDAQEILIRFTDCQGGVLHEKKVSSVIDSDSRSGYFDSASLFLAYTPQVDLDKVERQIVNGVFAPYEEWDSDSPSTQEEAFSADVREFLRETILSKEEAFLLNVKEAVSGIARSFAESEFDVKIHFGKTLSVSFI